ncbi:MAG: sugar nucleotide-binding protein [Planctomycetota bacterium]|nr:sugar nucleotide-binding protein [Planctomycetota bacterium]
MKLPNVVTRSTAEEHSTLRIRRTSIPVVPVTTEEFPLPEERPRYSVLTSTRSPRIVLRPWEEGVVEFARAIG